MRKKTRLPGEMFLPFLTVLLLLGAKATYAVEFTDPSEEDKAVFSKILEPVIKVYNLVKHVASAIAALALLIAGIVWMTSGADIRKRDTAKNIMAYVVIGLVVIWATPYAVNYIVA